MKWSLSRIPGKKNGFVRTLPMTLGLLLLSGCGNAETVFTDAGTNLVAETEASAYLDLSLLEAEPGETGTWNGYEVWTLEYGTFATDIVETRANINMVESVQVKPQLLSGSMILTELSVTKYSYVEEGDVLARVDVEISDIDLEEMELRLKRLEEELAQTVADYNERHEEALNSISVYELLGKIDRLEIAQMELDFAQTKAGYDKRIADYKEQIKEQKAMASTTEIVAPKSGFVLSVSRLQAGQELTGDSVICTIVPSDKMVLEFADESFHYGYGTELVLGVGAGSNPNRQEYSVTVNSANGKVLQEEWGKATTRIAGDFQLAEALEKGALMVGGKTNVMENVLLVPADGVTVENDKCYVTVLHEDGRMEKRQFVTGGNNLEYYWVFDGLEQGTKIIVEN